MNKPTITDIAKRLGITPSTVSRALAGSPRVKLSTREAVQKVAAEMGYERNILAANLRRGTASVVGIVVPRINREFFANVISSVEDLLNSKGYYIITCQSLEQMVNEVRIIRNLKRHQVAAIFVSHAIDFFGMQDVDIKIESDTVLIQFDRVFEDLEGPKIVADDIGGSYAATSHLIEKGYRRIGTVAGPESSSVFRGRLRGYIKALEDYGIPVDESIIFRDGIVRETGYIAGKKAVAAGCDALYCSGDFSALGVMDAIKEAGLSIPGQFGIVGTANETFTSLTSPTITSLSQNPEKMAALMVDAFLHPDSYPGSPTITVPMDLIIRESSSR